MQFSLFDVGLHDPLFSPITHSASAPQPAAHSRHIPTPGLLLLPFRVPRMLFISLASLQAPLPPSGLCPVLPE